MRESMNKQYYIITDITYVFIFQCSIHTYEEYQPKKNTDRTYQNHNIQSKGTVLVLVIFQSSF
jgi:hypothetical protein